MYTIGDTSWSAPPPVWFGPAVHLPTLRRLRASGASTCAILELESSFVVSSVVMWSSGLVCCLLAILGRRLCKASCCLLVVVGCVFIQVTFHFYRVAFIDIVLVVLTSSSMNLIHL
jgi:hypothetical protein